MQDTATFIVQVASVALIIVATRWLLSAKGSPLPEIRNDSCVYGIKWQWRAVALVGAAFWVVISIWSWHDLHSRPDKMIIAITVVLILIGLWLACGLVTTNKVGITKRVLWRSRSFQWSEITEIRLHKKDGGAIELRAGSRKLLIDSRFVAFWHLLREIEDKTQLLPSTK